MPSVTIATRTLYVTTQSAHLSAFVRKALQGMEQLAPVTITKYWMQPVVEVFRGLSVCRNLLVSPSESWCDSSSLPSSNFFLSCPNLCAAKKMFPRAKKTHGVTCFAGYIGWTRTPFSEPVVAYQLRSAVTSRLYSVKLLFNAIVLSIIGQLSYKRQKIAVVQSRFTDSYVSLLPAVVLGW